MDIIATSRQAIELAMTGKEIEGLTALSRSSRRGAGCTGRRCCLPIARTCRSLVWHEGLVPIIRRSSAPVAYCALAALGCDCLARDKAKEPGYPQEPWAMRLLARHAREHGLEAGHECLAGRGPAQCGRFSAIRSSRQGALPGASRCRANKMAEVKCVYREVQVLKQTAAKSRRSSRRNRTIRWRQLPRTKSLGSDDGAGYAAHGRLSSGFCARF